MRRCVALLLVVTAGCSARPVVDGKRCANAAACERVHPAGIAQPSSPDFHGKLIQSTGWNFATCQICHGADFAGGTSGQSCLTCHPSGPTSCTTCHAIPPTTGAHAAHTPKYACSECHVVPTNYADVGHLFTATGKVITKATVTFGALAAQGGVTPVWDGVGCSSTYCHGNAKPVWYGGADQALCGSCHGIPPADHASALCANCHVRVANNQLQIVGPALHVDGLISLGDDSGTCQACHPTANLSGAHTSHLTAAHALRAPLACLDCHVVPALLNSPGHIDHPLVQVFPLGWSGLGATDGAVPLWNAAPMTCSSTYCHGNGVTLGADRAPNLLRTPNWTPGDGAATCGACHGIPPVDGVHVQPLGLTECAACHPTTMNAQGGLIAGGTHMDGIFQYAP